MWQVSLLDHRWPWGQAKWMAAPICHYEDFGGVAFTFLSSSMSCAVSIIFKRSSAVHSTSWWLLHFSTTCLQNFWTCCSLQLLMPCSKPLEGFWGLLLNNTSGLKSAPNSQWSPPLISGGSPKGRIHVGECVLVDHYQSACQLENFPIGELPAFLLLDSNDDVSQSSCFWQRGN